jgi:hypothetical protein
MSHLIAPYPEEPLSLRICVIMFLDSCLLDLCYVDLQFNTSREMVQTSIQARAFSSRLHENPSSGLNKRLQKVVLNQSIDILVTGRCESCFRFSATANGHIVRLTEDCCDWLEPYNRMRIARTRWVASAPNHGSARTASLPSNPGIQTRTSGRFFDVTGIPRIPRIDISDLSNNTGSFPPDTVIIFAIRDFDYFTCKAQQRSQSAFSFQRSDSQSFIYMFLEPPGATLSPGPKGSDF